MSAGVPGSNRVAAEGSGRRRTLALWLIAAACLAWHVVGVVEGWRRIPADWAGDFASYHFAALVASEGGDPYDPEAVRGAAASRGYRHSVFPFIYPPLALPVFVWSAWLPLALAFRVWFVFQYALLSWIGYLLWRRWGPVGSDRLLLVVASIAALYPVLNGLFQGQTNLFVLALTLTALSFADRRPWLAGFLLGAGGMIKIAPLLGVAWWVWQGRWRPALMALVSLPVWAIASLPWADAGAQLDYFTRIVFEVSAGTYAALDVPADIFGNWSPTAFLMRVFPADGGGIPLAARTSGVVVAVATLALVAWCGRRRLERDGELLQVGALSAAVLLLTALTFEHHLVWTLPGLVALGSRAWRSGSSNALRVAYAAAWLALGVPLIQVRRLANVAPALEEVARHLKLAGIMIVLVGCAVLARRAARYARRDRAADETS